MSFKINGKEFVIENEKHLRDPTSHCYLRSDGEVTIIESQYWKQMCWSFEDGKFVSDDGVTLTVDGDDSEDVPVNRAAALIEEALNAKAAGCGCDCGCGPDCSGCECDCGCPKPVEEEEAPVEEEEAPVEEEEAPVEEAPVEEETPVEEEEFPELVEADT